MKKHVVKVYENGVEVDVCVESILVSHKHRFKHEFDNYTTYSYNTYYVDGTIHIGEIPTPLCYDARMKNLKD